MAYTPTTWVTGDTITAVKLNNMEQGIANAGGALLVECTTNIGTGTTTCNKTASEIAQAFYSGMAVILSQSYPEDSVYYVRRVCSLDFDNSIPEDFFGTMTHVNTAGNVVSWTIDTADGYPYTTSPF